MVPPVSRVVDIGEPTVDDADTPLGPCRHRSIMGDHADRQPVAHQPIDQLHDGVGGDRVEIAGRLVAQQDRRVDGQRSGHRDTLTLSAGQPVGAESGSVGHADPVERVERSTRDARCA